MTSDLQQVVKQKYGEAAIRLQSAAQKSCCETPGCQPRGEPETPASTMMRTSASFPTRPCGLH